MIGAWRGRALHEEGETEVFAEAATAQTVSGLVGDHATKAARATPQKLQLGSKWPAEADFAEMPDYGVSPVRYRFLSTQLLRLKIASSIPQILNNERVALTPQSRMS